jgi:uncharacterized small protein (TIGR04563 family)
LPSYLDTFETDWGWLALSEAERAVVRRHEARFQADPGTHTLATLMEALSEASRELPGREIRSRASDEGGEYALVSRDGRCLESEEGSFDEEGVFPESPTPDDYRAAGVGKVYVGLYWPENMLEAIKAQASRLDWSLSALVQKAWAIAKSSSSLAATSGDLPRDGARRKQSIDLPIDVYAEVAELATREDRSMSFVVQRALSAAWPAVTALPDSTG